MSESLPFDLAASRRNEHSQYGEDGILLKLFEIKGVEKGYFCEFGAWDGKHLSNTYALYELGWLGCYIEGLPARFEDLKRNISRPGMHLVQRFVRSEGPDRLDAILAGHLPETGLDVLSIDIDSDDLAILESLRDVRPRVIVIEFNPTIPFDTRYRNPPGMNRGNSALSIWEHAKANGYDLVAVTHCNLVLVDRNFNAGAFKTYELHEIRDHSGYRFFFGYDGTLIRAVPAIENSDDVEIFSVPWSRTVFPQPIAHPFRTFDEGSHLVRFGGLLSMAVTAVRRPIASLRLLAGLGPRNSGAGKR